MKRIASLIGITTLLTGVLVAGASSAAWAGSKSATLSFGTLESRATASNGDTVEVTGEGSWTLQPKSVSGDGGAVADAFGAFPRTFTHRNANGDVLAEGTWELTDVLSYRSFGPATQEQNDFFGGLPEGSEGGKVQLKIALYVDGVHVHDGILTIVCELGTPPKNTHEATELLVQGTPYNFNQAEHGDNIFIRE